MIIAIASENKPKVSACKKVFNELISKSKDDILFIVKSIDSGVGDMPMSLDDLMTGAKNRTDKLHYILKSENRLADYYVGLEGGFFIKYNSAKKNRVIFLESWVYVFNGTKGYWGSSGAIEVPEMISEEILKSGKELGVVIDEKMKQTGIRSNQGTVGILTKDKVTRQEFFESALIFALAPFLNSNIYN